MYVLAILRFISHVNVQSTVMNENVWLSHYEEFSILYSYCFYKTVPLLNKWSIYIMFIIPCLFIKCIFLSKPLWSPSRCNWNAFKIIIMTWFWQVHCDRIFANNLAWWICRAMNIHLVVSKTILFSVKHLYTTWNNMD